MVQEKKQLIKIVPLSLSLFTFQCSIVNDTYFILAYDMEEGAAKARQMITKKYAKPINSESNYSEPNEKPFPQIIPLNFIGHIAVSEILERVESKLDTKEKKEVQLPNKLPSKSSFICNLKLTAERYVKSKKDKEEFNRIISKIKL